MTIITEVVAIAGIVALCGTGVYLMSDGRARASFLLERRVKLAYLKAARRLERGAAQIGVTETSRRILLDRAAEYRQKAREKS